MMCKKTIFLFPFLFSFTLIMGQEIVPVAKDSSKINTAPLLPSTINTANRLLSQMPGLTIGGYAEAHYNHPINQNRPSLGSVDLHRLVLFLGYNFSNTTQFVSEIEFEHINEVYVEQAFIQQQISKYINLRAGLMLIPMGLINQYHEPNTFNGVERPLIDNILSPTSWREYGFGLSGTIDPIYSRYQFYVVSGLNGFDTQGHMSGKQPFRNARQKGINTYISSPNYTFNIEYYGIYNFNFGLSGYFGNSQSRHTSDSSKVQISMLGLDLRYKISGFETTSQFYFSHLSNTAVYNIFSSTDNQPNDLGKQQFGYYIELAYNLFQQYHQLKGALYPFVRYQYYDTHFKVDSFTPANKSYSANILTTGLTYKINPNVAFKCDLDWVQYRNQTDFLTTLNLGFGLSF